MARAASVAEGPSSLWRENASEAGDDSLVDVVEIRVLGPLYIRRVNGSLVDPAQWRTRKTADLVRILALRSGELVPVDRLLGWLWPDASADKARASLRTAASQVRRVLGADLLQRERDGLVLRGAWVDAQAFAALAGEARSALDEGHLERTVRAARQADALYLDDFEVSSDELQEWAEVEQNRLRRLHTTMLTDAATAAVSLTWMRDAVEFAERALEVDPYSERAYRAAMLAHSGLGEVEQALRCYQRCRDRLAAELGVDPSPQTQAVYLEVLRTEPRPRVVSPFVGRAREVAWLWRRVQDGVAAGSVIVVAGPPRMGTSRVVTETVDALGLPVRRMPHGDDAVTDLPSGVVVVDHLESWAPGRLRQLCLAVAREHQPVAVVAGHRLGVSPAMDTELAALADEGLVERLDLAPLARPHVTALAERLIGGPPTGELVTFLMAETGGLAGAVVDLVREWLSAGRLVHTGHGLDLLPAGAAAVNPFVAHRLLRQLHQQLSPREFAVLEVLAVAGTGVTAPAVRAVLGDTEAPGDADMSHHDVSAILSRLEDLTVVTADQSARFCFRQPMVRDALRSWLRPTVRRRLHRRIAEQLALPAHAHVAHWVAAGERQLAAAAAMEGADAALRERRYADAQARLLELRELFDEDSASPEDRVELLRLLSFCFAQLGEHREADETRAAARELVAAHGLAAVVHEPDAGVAAAASSPRSSALSAAHDLGPNAALSPEAEAGLRAAIADADRQQDDFDGVDARLLLAGRICIPQRRFTEARSLVRAARARAVTPEQRALSVLTAFEAGVLLGDPACDLQQIATAWQAGAELRAVASGLPVGVLCALAFHDRDEPEARHLLDDAVAEAESVPVDATWRWVAARMLLERGEVRHAIAVAEPATPGSIGPVGAMLSLMGQAALALAQGDAERAVAHLEAGVDTAVRSNATLLLPELACRLVALAVHDADTAAQYLDLAESALGEAAMGRERVAFGLARAAVRAARGRPLAAAEAAEAAAALATALRLPHWARGAHASRDAYLSAARSPGAGRSGRVVPVPTSPAPRMP